MIEKFVYDMPTRVLFGSGSLKSLHEEDLPGKKALVCISEGGSMKRHGQLDALVAELDAAGVQHLLFDRVRPNPEAANVDDAAKMAMENGCDFIIALGGGSVMDAAKAIAIVAANDGSCWDYSPSATGGKQAPENPALPLVAVTTSAGTGSEVDMWSVISNDATEEKTGYPTIFPTISVVDPDLMMSVPATFTAWQGMDAFFHAAESVINVNEHVVGEMFALKAIELIAKYLPRAVADGSDGEARANMAIANTLAGYYMLCTSEHTMEHALGSAHPGLVHGAGLIMISHEYFRFFADRKACEEQMAKMARAMGVEGATGGADFVAALDRLITDVRCADLKMSDYGIAEDELPTTVQKYHEVWGGNNDADPVKLTDEDVLGIYQRSYR
ncbi:iron-containing alcohol dehydrogenase [Curtanaerobium respiraculi]|uniref:iron-containing alcohol dehydrogenase n=1 Tax=Curtanaerobium respiraculi TaxID=2949669 RepID=UPI0024B3799A|nr:iron-containing alcohol dehydrogenase [Curtanaerobium respiraculi]